MIKIPSLNGLILAGGRSSRMGADKSQLEYHGAPQREYLFHLLSAYCNKVFISCKSDVTIPSHLNPLRDKLALDSPLNGIISAFRHKSTVAWLTVPVDMPRIDAGVIHCLTQERDSEMIATCFLDSSGLKPEPLLAIWEPASSSRLETYYANAGYSPREFLISNPHKAIVMDEPGKLLNINSPQDLKDYRQLHKTLHVK